MLRALLLLHMTARRRRHVIRFRRLSPAEIQEKRQNGQCYFCPEPYSKDHKCAAKGIFLMELEEGEVPIGDDITNLEISLYIRTNRSQPC
jgi:hypothetical protein